MERGDMMGKARVYVIIRRLERMMAQEKNRRLS